MSKVKTSSDLDPFVDLEPGAFLQILKIFFVRHCVARGGRQGKVKGRDAGSLSGEEEGEERDVWKSGGGKEIGLLHRPG